MSNHRELLRSLLVGTCADLIGDLQLLATGGWFGFSSARSEALLDRAIAHAYVIELLCFVVELEELCDVGGESLADVVAMLMTRSHPDVLTALRRVKREKKS